MGKCYEVRQESREGSPSESLQGPGVGVDAIVGIALRDRRLQALAHVTEGDGGRGWLLAGRGYGRPLPRCIRVSSTSDLARLA